ncbi:MAG: dihydroorotate dehydrogenase electron transfer subunit [Candidatus Hodarchaeota archaeon]
MVNRYNLPFCLPIFAKNFENESTATISFLIPEGKEPRVVPGQYFMLWLPGNDEIPIAVNHYQENIMSFTIRGVGPTTKEIIRKKKNFLIGLRGPFGNGFDLDYSRNIIIVAGGIGIAPLRFLIHRLITNPFKSTKIVLIQGAKTKSELLFREEFEQLPITTKFCTEDGSYGFHGLVSEKMNNSLVEYLDEQLNWEIYSCGPELMLKNILTTAQDLNLEKHTQICLADRYIRCGFGICGSCFLDDLGLSICQDGPVFRGDLLAQVEDFGKFGRTADGSKYSFS